MGKLRIWCRECKQWHGAKMAACAIYARGGK